MKFTINSGEINLINLARKLGYIPRASYKEEYEFIRPLLGRDYPRFHIYIRENKDKNILAFSLHLDQKKPSYRGASAHSGEYEGEIVEKEAERIKKIIEGNTS